MWRSALSTTSSSMSDQRYQSRRRTIKRRGGRGRHSARRRFWRSVKSGRFVVSFFAFAAVFLFTLSGIIAVKAILSRSVADDDELVPLATANANGAYDEEPVTETTEVPLAEEIVEKPLDPEVASFAPGYTFERTDATRKLPKFKEDGSGSSVVSQYVVLVDVDNGEIVSERKGGAVINPASMTKILTLLVAVEQLEEQDIGLDETYKITDEITHYTYQHDCSVVGFSPKERVTVEDLLYGTILPSGADAVLGLCDLIAGGQDEFVALMNEKVEQLGLEDTAHFTNATGLYDEQHHCTPTDMAAILKAALLHEECRKVLDARTYTTSSTKQHPDGILISNWFLRRIEDKELPGDVSGAKTGFVKESGNCAASYLVTDDGRHYICVTGWSTSAWRCIYDHVDIYNAYVEHGMDAEPDAQEGQDM